MALEAHGGGSGGGGGDDEGLDEVRSQGEKTACVPGRPDDQPEGEEVPQRVGEELGAARQPLLGGDPNAQPVR